MAHYAILNSQNIVVNTIVGKEEDSEGIDWEIYLQNKLNRRVKRYSINTKINQHFDSEGNLSNTQEKAFRLNTPAPGWIYRDDLDGFIQPESMQPFPSWTIDENLGIYQAPVAYPGDQETEYAWNEEGQSWDLITEQNGGT